MESQVHRTFGASTISDLSFINSDSVTQIGSPTYSSVDLGRNLESFGEECESLASEQSYFLRTEQVEFDDKYYQHFLSIVFAQFLLCLGGDWSESSYNALLCSQMLMLRLNNYVKSCKAQSQCTKELVKSWSMPKRR